MTELRPVWADAPRLCPGPPWPAYRHVPGLTPHPTRHPDGHSVSGPPHAGLCARNTLLFGIDLYHQGYLWEAHEAWEKLWQQVGRGSREGRLLKALIKITAAVLKAHMGSTHGASRHSRDACAILESILGNADPLQGGVVLGIDVAALVLEVKRCFEPLWTSPCEDSAPATGPFPRITFAQGSTARP